jgi:sulfoxide reductase heme-binding subunit YedZ
MPTMLARFRTSLALWRDRRGRASPFRVATLATLVLPILLTLNDIWAGQLGPRPINNMIHRSGFWALVFLLATLAISPLARVGRFAALFDIRRILGVGVFCYAVAHISLYAADQMFDLGKVASEIVHRIYLAIGFAALLGLAALAITSTDQWMQRLGGRWQVLHQTIYAIAVLAIVHFFQQTKADLWMPTFVAGIAGWLLGYRLIARRRRGEMPTWALLALAVAVAALTFAGEAIGIAAAFHAPPMAVLRSALDFDPATIRPGWFVLAAGLAVVAVDLVRTRTSRRAARAHA